MCMDECVCVHVCMHVEVRSDSGYLPALLSILFLYF